MATSGKGGVYRPNAPTRTPRGNASTGVGAKPMGTRPASRGTPPSQVNAPTKTARGNASASPGATRGKVGTRPVPAVPATRAAPPRLVNVPTKAPKGRGGTSVSGAPTTAPKPKKTPPGPYGQPVVSRGTIGAGGPTSVSPAPPQKKGSPGLVGGGTVGKPVTGTMLKKMGQGPILPKGAARAKRLPVGSPRNRGKG